MKFSCLSALAALAWAVVACRAGADPADLPPVPRVLTTQFTYTATIPAPSPDTKQLDVWVPLPSDSEWQTVRDVSVDSSVPYKITREPKFGNRMVYLHADKPHAAFVVTVRCVVARKAIQTLTPDAAQANTASSNAFGPSTRLLAGDQKVPIGGRYGDIAQQVAGEKIGAVEKMRAIFEHTVANMQYDYKKESPHYAEGDVAFVCDYKKGNCSDLHSYMISLARSQGIPAVLEFGFPITGIPLADPLPQEGSIGGYHCWLWFQTPKQGWVPLDASDARRWLDARRPDVKEKLFGSLVLERSAVAFSRGRDLTLAPAQKGQPLNYFIYPYAEADGKSTEAKWEIHYRRVQAAAAASADPAVQDLQRQVTELRQLLTQQSQEIARLRDQQTNGGAAVAAQSPATQPTSGAPAGSVASAPPAGNRASQSANPPTTVTPPSPVPAGVATSAPPAGPPLPLNVPSRERISLYGFLRADAIFDGSATNNTESPFYVLSPGNTSIGRNGNSVFTIHPRLSRVGLNLAAPSDTLRGFNVTGKFEVDFQNGSGLTPDSRPLPRIRLAYLQLQRGANSLLIGQNWDIISPLNPSPNDDTLMWNAGNLGDRRAQIRYTYEPANRPFVAAIGLGLTGAVDSNDLDANGIRDGEDSGLPNIQARIGWKGRRASVGIWGHHAWETATKGFDGHVHFTSYSVGLDAQAQATKQLDLRGELWTGQNLSDFRGGIGQGINPTTGQEIRASGGWFESGYQFTPSYRAAIGYTLDSPNVRDIPKGGRTLNDAVYLHNRLRLGGNTSVGLNYLFWTTKYKGLASGTDNRISTFVQHDF